MRNALLTLGLIGLALVAGCNKASNSTGTTTAVAGVTPTIPIAASSTAATTDTATQVSFTPEQLAQIGADIKKQPDQSTQILQQNGLTEATFEQAIRQLTQNPDASKRYSAAFKKASA